MANITYLLGAGASAKTLPTVNQIPERIGFLIELLKKQSLSPKPFDDFVIKNKSVHVMLQELITDLSWLKSEAEKHASVDTLAKKLFIKKQIPQLNTLKAALSAFLTFEQILREMDRRYDSFFASILQREVIKLPNNIKILSWNYDFQLEKAYSAFTDYESITDNQNVLNVYTKFHHVSDTSNQFAVYKLNGTAGVFESSRMDMYNMCYKANHMFNTELMEIIIKHYILIKDHKSVHSTLSFAWENWKVSHDIVDNAVNAVKNTDVLVIIGYSFPFFNRDVDRKIIGAMTSLKKVYFQDIHPEIIKERFKAVKEIVTLEQSKLYKDPTALLTESDLVTHRDTEQFLLPNEL